jgi:hypothetical protein
MKPRKLLNVLPECYVDTNLIEYLLDAGVNHQHSCSKVVGQLNTTFANSFAVGIIDKDKVEMGYVKECEMIAKTEHLILLRHNTRMQYLVMVAPAIDGFILDCARQDGVDPLAFGIPADLKGFTQESKAVTSNTDPRFKHLFAALKGNGEISALRTTLHYLCENQYNADIEVLKGLFSIRQAQI